MINLIEPIVAMSILNKIPLTTKQLTQICEQYEHNSTILNNTYNEVRKKAIKVYLGPILVTSLFVLLLQVVKMYSTYIVLILIIMALITFLFYSVFIILFSIITCVEYSWILIYKLFKEHEYSFYNKHPSRSSIPSLAQRLKVSPRVITNNNDAYRETLNTLLQCTQNENNDRSSIYDTRSTRHISLLLQKLNRMLHEDSSTYALLNKIDRLLTVPVFPYMRNKADEEPESYFTQLHNLRLPLMLGLIRSLEESGDASCLKTLQHLAARGYCPEVRQAALKACPIVEERGRLNQQPSTLLRAASGHDANSLLVPVTSKPMSNSGLLRQSGHPNGVTSSRDDVETVVIKKSE